MLKKAGNILFYIIITILIISSLTSLLMSRPFLAAAIRSWSMEPVLTRGDMAILIPATEKTKYKTGDIVVFRSEEKGIKDWTMHRIVGGDAENGFTTKGDNNQVTDQEGYGYPVIEPGWIAGVVPTIGDKAIKIPLIGHLPLLLESGMGNPAIISIFIGVLMMLLLLIEILKPKKKKEDDILIKGQFYFLGGIAFMVFMGAIMIMGSLFVDIPFGVGDSSAALMGSNVGVIRKGTVHTFTLAELKNEGAIPSNYYIVSNDSQITVESGRVSLSHGETLELEATIRAENPGMNYAKVTVGMFLPFLPSSVIARLVRINYWLALLVVSLVPAIPLFVIPYLDRKYRRGIKKAWRKRLALFGV